MSDIVERLRDANDPKRFETRLEAAAEIERLTAAVVAQDNAARDVQEHWSDPGSYTHNRLLTPQLVHETTITDARRALEGK